MLNYRKINKKSKRAQIGETVTWVIATLIIIGVLIIFIGLSFLMSKSKAIASEDVKTDLSKESKQLATKTFLAEQLNSQNEELIENILKEENG